MAITLINPKNNLVVNRESDFLINSSNNRFPIINEIPRFASSNYASNFGFQWSRFRTTQLDNDNITLSKARFFAETRWLADDLEDEDILEVGSGAGRFSRVILNNTRATLWSVDYSEAVDNNFESNGSIAPQRFKLFQASIYEMPFPNESFDRVFCFGVLQHTPDFEASVSSLVAKAKIGAEIVVDFYPVKGWWTKIQAKYLLRSFTKRINHDRLLLILNKNVDWLVKVFDGLNRRGLGTLTRFLPIADLRLLPSTLTAAERREWALLDTFDMFSPEYDRPQRIQDVVKMFERSGAQVTFAGTEIFEGGESTVVRAVKIRTISGTN